MIVKITVETNITAPVEEVWRAYTTPEDIKQWNAASDDWHTTAASVDLREGGKIFLTHGGQGRQHGLRFRRNVHEDHRA
jgi:uncharacterized protein YndB with AHSA1/START domain